MITFFAVVIVLAAIALAAWPLLRGSSRPAARLVEDAEVSDLLAQKDASLFAISELESDHQMGSLSKQDYQELKDKYMEKAVTLIKAADELKSERGLATAGLEEEIEERISRVRSGRSPDIIEQQVAQMRTGAATKECPACNGKLRADAAFCSHCGAAISVKCPSCAAVVSATDKFCSGCGHLLDAGSAK